MKILILRVNKEKYVPARLQEEGKKLGYQVDIKQYQELFWLFHQKNNLKNLEKYDAFVFRAAGTTSGRYIPFRDNLIRHMTRLGKFCLNGESYLKFSRLGKLTQHYFLLDSDLPVIKTMCFGSDLQLTEIKKRLLKNFNFPILVKPRFGSQGRDIFLLKKIEDIKHENIDDLLFQEFLRTKVDYRIIVIGGKVIGGMKRSAVGGSIVTNYSQGGSITKAELDDKKKKIALQTAKLFNLDYAGVDIMEDKAGNNYVLEVNRACWFKGFEKSTGVNVAGHLIEHIVKSI